MRKHSCAPTIQNLRLALVAAQGRRRGEDLRASRRSDFLKLIERGLVVRIHRPEAVAQQMKLVLQAEGDAVEFGRHGQRSGRYVASWMETTVRPLEPSGVGVPVARNRTEPLRCGDHASHVRLKGDARGLVEGAHHDGGKVAPHLGVDHVNRQRLARAPMTLRVRATMFEAPELDAEVHRDRIPLAKRTHPKRAQAFGHRGVLVVPFAAFAFGLGVLDLVGRRASADQEAEAERIAPETFAIPHDLRTGERVRETLGLLERQKTQRKAGPCRDPGRLAAQAIEEGRGQNQPEVGLGLPPAGRKPDDVDHVLFPAEAGAEVREEKAHLERAPAVVTKSPFRVPSGVRHGRVHRSEGVSESRTRTEQLDPFAQAFAFGLESLALGLEFGTHRLGPVACLVAECRFAPRLAAPPIERFEQRLARRDRIGCQTREGEIGRIVVRRPESRARLVARGEVHRLEDGPAIFVAAPSHTAVHAPRGYPAVVPKAVRKRFEQIVDRLRDMHAQRALEQSPSGDVAHAGRFVIRIVDELDLDLDATVGLGSGGNTNVGSEPRAFERAERLFEGPPYRRRFARGGIDGHAGGDLHRPRLAPSRRTVVSSPNGEASVEFHDRPPGGKLDQETDAHRTRLQPIRPHAQLGHGDLGSGREPAQPESSSRVGVALPLLRARCVRSHALGEPLHAAFRSNVPIRRQRHRPCTSEGRKPPAFARRRRVRNALASSCRIRSLVTPYRSPNS